MLQPQNRSNTNHASGQKAVETDIQRMHRQSFYRDQVAKKNFTLMLIATSFLYIIGNLPYSVYYGLKEAFGIRREKMSTLLWLSQIFLSSFIMFKLLVYYMFNKPFRNVLNSYIKIFLTCNRNNYELH